LLSGFSKNPPIRCPPLTSGPDPYVVPSSNGEFVSGCPWFRFPFGASLVYSFGAALCGCLKLPQPFPKKKTGLPRFCSSSSLQSFPFRVPCCPVFPFRRVLFLHTKKGGQYCSLLLSFPFLPHAPWPFRTCSSPPHPTLSWVLNRLTAPTAVIVAMSTFALQSPSSPSPFLVSS